LSCPNKYPSLEPEGGGYAGYNADNKNNDVPDVTDVTAGIAERDGENVIPFATDGDPFAGLKKDTYSLRPHNLDLPDFLDRRQKGGNCSG
jgi:hypothetical protein